MEGAKKLAKSILHPEPHKEIPEREKSPFIIGNPKDKGPKREQSPFIIGKPRSANQDSSINKKLIKAGGIAGGVALLLGATYLGYQNIPSMHDSINTVAEHVGLGMDIVDGLSTTLLGNVLYSNGIRSEEQVGQMVDQMMNRMEAREDFIARVFN